MNIQMPTGSLFTKNSPHQTDLDRSNKKIAIRTKKVSKDIQVPEGNMKPLSHVNSQLPKKLQTNYSVNYSGLKYDSKAIDQVIFGLGSDLSKMEFIKETQHPRPGQGDKYFNPIDEFNIRPNFQHQSTMSNTLLRRPLTTGINLRNLLGEGGFKKIATNEFNAYRNSLIEDRSSYKVIEKIETENSISTKINTIEDKIDSYRKEGVGNREILSALTKEAYKKDDFNLAVSNVNRFMQKYTNHELSDEMLMEFSKILEMDDLPMSDKLGLSKTAWKREEIRLHEKGDLEGAQNTKYAQTLEGLGQNSYVVMENIVNNNHISTLNSGGLINDIDMNEDYTEIES